MRTISRPVLDSPGDGPGDSVAELESRAPGRRHLPHHRGPSTVARMRLPALLAALALLLLTACGNTADAARSSDSGDARDLDFTSTTVAGEKFEGSTLAGKPTVLWFWAPWCPTCVGQIDGVSSLAEAHPEDLNVVGVGSLDDPTAIAGFAEKVSPAVTMLGDGGGGRDGEGAVWRHFGVKAQSTYLVLDEDGKQVASGYLSDEELEKVVETMVG